MFSEVSQLIAKEKDNLCRLVGLPLSSGKIMYFGGYQVVALAFEAHQIFVLFPEDQLELYWQAPEGCVSVPYKYTELPVVQNYSNLIEECIGQRLSGILATEYPGSSANAEAHSEFEALTFQFANGKILRVENIGDETGVANQENVGSKFVFTEGGTYEVSAKQVQVCA